MSSLIVGIMPVVRLLADRRLLELVQEDGLSRRVPQGEAGAHETSRPSALSDACSRDNDGNDAGMHV
jgi:hypothetical protein